MSSIYNDRDKFWRYQRYVDGKKVVKTIGQVGKITKRRLKKIKSELDVEYDQRKIVPKSDDLRPVIRAYLESLKIHASPKHVYNQNLFLGYFVEFAGGIQVQEIKKTNVQAYLSYLIKKPKTRGSGTLGIRTIRNYVNALYPFFEWCIERGYLTENPNRKLKLPKENTKPPVFLSQEQAKKLLDSADEVIRPMIAFAIFTGLRAGELLRLRWEDVNIENNSLIVRKSKNRRFRTVYYPDGLKDFITPKKEGKVFDGHEIPPNKRWIKVRSETGIQVKWHHLRHTYASWLTMSGADILTVTELMGHVRLESTMIYAHLAEEHKKKAVQNLKLKQNDTPNDTPESHKS